MACCALAAFLISQIIFGLDWARERLGFAPPSPARINPATVWRPGAAALLAPPRSTGARLRMAAVGGGVAFVVMAALTLGAEAGHPRWSAFGLICTTHGLVRIAPPLG